MGGTFLGFVKHSIAVFHVINSVLTTEQQNEIC